jgi:hypothetical protein
MLEVDLNRARQNVQQFQAISATNEEALASLGATHETYKAEAEGAIARLQVKGFSLYSGDTHLTPFFHRLSFLRPRTRLSSSSRSLARSTSRSLAFSRLLKPTVKHGSATRESLRIQLWT